MRELRGNKISQRRIGVNIKVRRFLFCLLTLILTFSFSFQQVAFAGRSHAGGGDLAKFDAGKWASGTAIGVASMTVGTALAGGIAAGIGGASFTEGFTTMLSPVHWATGFNVMSATKEVGRAVNNMGGYYGWNPKTTIVVSSVAQGIAGGGLDPSGYGASGALSGMGLGAINGAVSGGVLAGLADKKGNTEPWMGAVAGLAGGFASGFTNGAFSGKGVGVAVKEASISTLKSVPAQALGAGVGYITAKSKDPMDRYMIQQAFSGVTPMVNAVFKPESVIKIKKDAQGKIIGLEPAKDSFGVKTSSTTNTGSSFTTQTPSYNSSSSVSSFRR